MLRFVSGFLTGNIAKKCDRLNCRASVTTICLSVNCSAERSIRYTFFSVKFCRIFFQIVPTLSAQFVFRLRYVCFEVGFIDAKTNLPKKQGCFELDPEFLGSIPKPGEEMSKKSEKFANLTIRDDFYRSFKIYAA